MTVRAVLTFPEPRQPGIAHDACAVGAQGLAGDRRRRAAVSVVGHDSPGTRANLVLDAPTTDVEALAGRLLRVGPVLLAVEPTGNHCAGLYAAVGEAGTVAVGDVVEVVEDAS
ncbi:hypothetical protein [Phycicoccus flavus]|uniref:MOSC domain-containing protein n=1 Tax=Phycicoccus flavus TaxID=2502783 RepID=A0A8T6R077_9MICO|nr:hypothetical protein [Phycicoccus flavus]NHA67648.1 hypothetical protein [Phycicoccus flavus]